MTSTFSCVLLAGDRGPNDPVARRAGVPCKALAPVAGRPMVLRVLDILLACEHLDQIILCGPPESALSSCGELETLIKQKRVLWLASESSPCLSAQSGLTLVEDSGKPVLLTTADHALLSDEILEHFLQGVLTGEQDLSPGLVPYPLIRDAFPGSRRTVLRLGNGGYCACNLFALKSARGREILAVWRALEQQRKKPLRLVAGLLGYGGVLRYLLGQLTMAQAFQRVSQNLNMLVEPVIVPFPTAAVDVDTPEDLEFANEFAKGQPF